MSVWRKAVPEKECVAIAAEMRALLDQVDSGGRRVWTQASLGKACGMPQQHIQRALRPEGVGPAAREGILKVTGLSMEALLQKHAVAITAARRLALSARGGGEAGPFPAAAPGLVSRATVLKVLQALEHDGCDPDSARQAVMHALEHSEWESELDLYRGAKFVLESHRRVRTPTGSVSGVVEATKLTRRRKGGAG